MRLHAIVPLLVFVAVVATSAAARADAPPVALLPVAAERVGLEAMPQMARTDDLLRRVVAARTDVRLLSKIQTAENLASIREMGISCAVDDVRCLGKVAVLVDVDRVLVPILRMDSAATVVRVLVVDRLGRSADAQVTTPALPTEAELGSLVAVALGAELVEQPARPGPTTSTAATPAAPAVVAPPAAEPTAGPRPLLVGGIVTASVGTVACLAGVAGALAVDALLAEPEDYAIRESRMGFGQALVGASVIGGLVGIAGGALVLADTLTEAPAR
jgi:hypothetical protein